MGSKSSDSFRRSIGEALFRTGMTQAELAEKAGLTQASVSRLLAGKSEPDLRTVDSISIALGVPSFVLLMPSEERARYEASAPKHADLKARLHVKIEQMGQAELETLLAVLPSPRPAVRKAE